MRTLYPQVEGLMSDGDLLHLRKRERDTRNLNGGKLPVLEIGSFCGLSTLALSEEGSLVYAVDTFAGGEDLPVRNTYKEFIRNVSGRNVVVYVGRSQEAWPHLPELFRLIFIDGSHKYENVLLDLMNAMYHIAPGGYIVVDDIGWESVRNALNTAGLKWESVSGTKMAEVRA